MIKRDFKNQKGVALVEFAIVLPLILLLLFGIIEFGVMLYNKQVITNASREGARAAINPLPIKTQTEVFDIVTDYCNRLIYFGSRNDINISPSLDPNRNFGDQVTIQVSWQYNFLLPSIIGLGANTTIGAETKMNMM